MNAAIDRDLRVLMVEDVPTDAEVTEAELRESGLRFAARRVETRDDFIRALEDFEPDVILADNQLPAFDGLSALRLARERRPDTPVIMVTGTLGDELAAELLREGACDYILKDRLSRLGQAVLRALANARAAIEARNLAKALRISENKYRRLFETSKDGILIVDAATGAIEDANPFLAELLGYADRELIGRKPWELCISGNAKACQDAFTGLPEKRYVRYENLPLESRDGRPIDVEVIGNAYEEDGGHLKIQFSIRDISDRVAVQKALQAQLDELRRFQKVTIDRELRIRELKEANQRLKEQLAAMRKAGS